VERARAGRHADRRELAASLLLRDRDRPNVFRSFGSWPDLETIERFRRDIVAPALVELRELLENIETMTQDEVYPGG
jgi:hypothetical protein